MGMKATPTASSTRSITLYLHASDTKNVPKVTFKEREAAGGDGLNINVSTDFALSASRAAVTWPDSVAVISQYHWITMVLHRQCVFKKFQIKLKKNDKPSLELLQQMDDGNISQYELKIRDRLRSLEILTSRWW